MAHRVLNQTTRQVTLNLTGGNAITLLPVGTQDAKGSADRGILLEGEELAVDVVNAQQAGEVTLEPIVPVSVATEPPAGGSPAAPAEPETTPPQRKRTRSSAT